MTVRMGQMARTVLSRAHPAHQARAAVLVRLAVQAALVHQAALEASAHQAARVVSD